MKKIEYYKNNSDNDREMWLSLYYYFVENLSLVETAERLGIHRLKVSRNIARAKQEYKFKVILEPPREFILEGKLKERFPGLIDYRVVPIESDNPQTVAQAIGIAGSRYFEDLVETYIKQNPGKKIKIGIAGGITIEKLIDDLIPKKFSGLEIYPLIAGPFPQSKITADTLANRMASKYDGATADGIVKFCPAKSEEKEIIINLKYVTEVLQKIKAVDIAIVGIGSLFDGSTLGKTVSGLELDIENLRRTGVCGDICYHLLSENGNIVKNETINRIIGISAQDLKDIYRKNKGRIIGVCGGIKKAKAIAAALLGGTDGKEPWIDTVIIDDKTCEEVLKYVKREAN